MRSRPSTPPSPSPPIFDGFAAMLPVPQKTYRSKDDADIPLYDLDPETSRLIPTKRRTHRVWVQGRLAAVRSVSKSRRGGGGTGSTNDVADRKLASGAPSPSSLDDSEEMDEESERETNRRARQLRGYGIGGIGNIRRPTDVIYGPNRSATFARSQPDISTRVANGSPATGSLNDGQKWNLRDFLALRADTRGEEKRKDKEKRKERAA